MRPLLAFASVPHKLRANSLAHKRRRSSAASRDSDWRAIVQESGSAAGLPQSVSLPPVFQSVCDPIGQSSPRQPMSEVYWRTVDLLGFRLATSID
jgi:hypothetical protein